MDVIESGLPVFGTCAGLLLLAKRIDNDHRSHFATMDITAVRNGYGRQLGSLHTEETFKGLGRIWPYCCCKAIKPAGDGFPSGTIILGGIENGYTASKETASGIVPEIFGQIDCRLLFRR